MSIELIKKEKADLDQFHNTNMRVELEFVDGKLFAINLKVLPLSVGINYRILAENKRLLEMFLQQII